MSAAKDGSFEPLKEEDLAVMDGLMHKVDRLALLSELYRATKSQTRSIRQRDTSSRVTRRELSLPSELNMGVQDVRKPLRLSGSFDGCRERSAVWTLRERCKSRGIVRAKEKIQVRTSWRGSHSPVCLYYITKCCNHSTLTSRTLP